MRHPPDPVSKPRKNPELSSEEHEELLDLHNEINNNLAALGTEDIERYVDLFARSLIGKGDV
jgi:hypothetical protein